MADPIAASSTSDRVTSQVLFERGRALLIEGRFAEACPTLEESHRLAPGIGVLLHLGACLEKFGKTSSAWAAFQEATDRARAEGDTERESIARARATELRSKLSYLTLRLSDAPQGLQILRDGQVISTAALGLEVPIDPGQHNIVVRAPGMVEATRSVTVSEGDHASVDVELLPLPQPTPPPQATRVESPAVAPRLDPPQPEPSSTRPLVAWTSAGVGTVGLLTGAAAGLMAYTKMQDARALCEGHPKNDCPAESVRLQEQARLPAGIATAGVAVGVAGLAFAGGYWLLSRPQRTVVTGSASPGIALITLRTHW